MAFVRSGIQEVEMAYIFHFAEKIMLGAFRSLQYLALPRMNDVCLSILPSEQR